MRGISCVPDSRGKCVEGEADKARAAERVRLFGGRAEERQGARLQQEQGEQKGEFFSCGGSVRRS